MTGISTSWHDFEIEATELGRDLERVLFRQSESQLAQLAQQDPLTGLPNRRRLMDRLEHAFAKYARGEELAVLFVDLDGFKAVNDSLGHDVGDLVLIRAGQQLVAGARAHDTVARIGGDEFVIVCENTSAEQAEAVAQRIVESVRISVPQVDPDVEPFKVTVSVGIASAASAFDAADLLKQADGAMYRAKLGGRDKYSR